MTKIGVQRISIIVILTLSLFLQSCASIINGSRQKVKIDSFPSGATIIVSGQEMGVTPTKINLSRKKSYSLELEKDGYETESAYITKQFNGWIWGNLIFGGPIGAIIDFGTGASYSFVQNDYVITLNPENFLDLASTDIESLSDTKEFKVREYVVEYGDNIRLELEVGDHGPAINALITIITTDYKEFERATRSIKFAANNSTNNEVFAGLLIDSYSPTRKLVPKPVPGLANEIVDDVYKGRLICKPYNRVWYENGRQCP